VPLGGGAAIASIGIATTMRAAIIGRIAIRFRT
jgi:hypothetical protein